MSGSNEEAPFEGAREGADRSCKVLVLAGDAGLADCFSTGERHHASQVPFDTAHIRVITLISGRRCQGRPTTSASNWDWVNDNGVVDASRGHAK